MTEEQFTAAKAVAPAVEGVRQEDGLREGVWRVIEDTFDAGYASRANPGLVKPAAETIQTNTTAILSLLPTVEEGVVERTSCGCNACYSDPTGASSSCENGPYWHKEADKLRAILAAVTPKMGDVQMDKDWRHTGYEAEIINSNTGEWEAGVVCDSLDDAIREGKHYAAVYGQVGPVKLHLWERAHRPVEIDDVSKKVP